MTSHYKLLKAVDILIDVVKDAQAKFSQATYFLNFRPATDLTRGQKEGYLIKSFMQILLPTIS